MIYELLIASIGRSKHYITHYDDASVIYIVWILEKKSDSFYTFTDFQNWKPGEAYKNV